jgi:L-lactate utilization protein LutB
VTIPKRPYLIPALEDNKEEILKIFNENIETHLLKNNK